MFLLFNYPSTRKTAADSDTMESLQTLSEPADNDSTSIDAMLARDRTFSSRDHKESPRLQSRVPTQNTERGASLSTSEIRSPSHVSGVKMRMRMYKSLGRGNLRSFAPFNAMLSSREREIGTMVPRTLHIRIKQLKFFQSVSKSKTYLAIGVRLRGTKLREMMRSSPIAVDDNAALDIPLDLEFSMEYCHKLKGKPNILQLILQKRKRRSNPYRNIGYLHIPVDEILQKPVYSLAIAYESKTKLKGEVATLLLEVSTEFGINSSAKQADSDGKEGVSDVHMDAVDDIENDIEITDSEDEAEEKAEYGTFQTYLRSGYPVVSALDDEKEQTLSNKIAETMVRVKETGSKLIDRIRTNLRRKSDPEVRPIETPEEPEVNSKNSSRMNSSTLKVEDASCHSEVTGDSSAFYNASIEDQLSLNIEPGFASQKCFCIVDKAPGFGKRLLKWSNGSRMNSLLHSHNVIAVSSPSDVTSAFDFLISKFRTSSRRGSSEIETAKYLKIIIAGGDWCVHAILESFVKLMSKEPRSWDNLYLYAIPVYRSKDPTQHRISQALASQDPIYRSLFFSKEWKSAVQTPEIVEPVFRGIESCISRYVKEASFPQRIPISLALIEEMQSESTQAFKQTQLPFVRDFEVHSAAEDNLLSTLRPILVNIDYWHFSSKKNKIKKTSIKTDLIHLRMSRLSFIDTISDMNSDLGDSKEVSESNRDISEKAPPRASSAIPPTLFDNHKEMDVSVLDEFESKSLTMQIKYLTKDKRRLTNRLVKAPRAKGKPEDVSFIEEQVSKIVISSETGFSATIDGISMSKLKFVSISPEWSGRLKSFPLHGFEANA